MPKKQVQDVDQFEVKPIVRPDLTDLSPNIVEYIEWLEKQTETLQSELDAKPYDGEAMGIAWGDFYGLVTDNAGQQQIFKVNITSRSRVNPGNALDLFIEAARNAKNYNLHPYRPAFSLPVRQPATQPTKELREPVTELLGNVPDENATVPGQTENGEILGP